MTPSGSGKIEFYQAHLDRVSRSFALGIQQLDPNEREWVGLSYLLFRILDTIEDSAWPSKEDQQKSFNQFRSFINSAPPSEREVMKWSSEFPSSLPDGERLLLADAHLLLTDLHRLSARVRAVVSEGVISMSFGMEYFAAASATGSRLKLRSTVETDQYCFFVAGIVGELLTKLVAEHNDFKVSDEMLSDAFHFGLFLQKINLLKDQREDALEERYLIADRAATRASVEKHGWHSLRYIQQLPVAWRSYRIFCAWALYLGLASLPWIDRAWQEKTEEKIPRAKALLLMQRLRRMIDDNEALEKEARQYLKGCSPGRAAAQTTGQVPQPAAWFRTAYLGDLSNAQLWSLGVVELNKPQLNKPELKSEIIQQAILCAEKALLSRRRDDGSWVGEVELNPGPTAQAVMLHAALRKAFPENLKDKAARYILRTQNSDGGWSPHTGAPSEVSLSSECYAALRFLDFAHDDERLVAAARFIRGNGGGVGAANAWTQLYLAVLGVLPWRAVHKTPLEILLLPERSPLHVGNLSYWVKAIVIPMALLGEVGPGEPHPLAREISIELGIEPAEFRPDGQSLLTATLIKFAEQLRGRPLLKSLRGVAVQRAWQWIARMTEASGDFGGNTCTAINVLLALDRSGRGNEPQFEAGYRAFMSYGIDDSVTGEWRLQCCQSHIWDTSLALKSLPKGSDSNRSIAWLLDREIRKTKGPWSREVSAEPAAWCFGNRHDLFPVTDCTALALLAIAKHGDASLLSTDAVTEAVEWLLAMQDPSGGWAAYERPRQSGPFAKWLNKIAKFKDIENALMDLPKADVSAKVVEALATMDRSLTGVELALTKARDFLLSQRNNRGLWQGNYGVNFIYGTSFACSALAAIDRGPAEEWALAAREFFLSTQNADGGWGESDESYSQPELAGIGAASSPVQTAWALSGLCACLSGTPRERWAIQQAAEYLARTQSRDGLWAELFHQGTVFPGKVYFKYELYPLYFPLAALRDAIKTI